MKALKLVLRQGDVALWTVEAPPRKRSRVQASGDRIIAARGEATGHNHSFAPADVELYEAEPGVPFRVEMPDGSLADALFVKVLQDASLEHQEHNVVVATRQNYWVVMPRAYTPAAIVRSTD